MRNKNIFTFLILLCLSGCAKIAQVEITHSKLEIPKAKVDLPNCKIQQTNEYELNNGMFFDRAEYIKLVKNTNTMRACYNDVKEKYKLSVENYNNLIDTINENDKKK